MDAVERRSILLELVELTEWWINEIFHVQDNVPTLSARHRRSDAREMQSFYQNYYDNYVKALDGTEHSDR